ncbi:methylmalonyl Co-A mutase-associated GTPase MeaB [Actimicrobium antarcticum]
MRVAELVSGIREGQPRALAKAITQAESTRADHQGCARRVLDALLPDTGQAIRVGITGVPGVGKSTFIEVLGLHLLALGHRVAVLAVDPSSSLGGGAILGDKTRMELLARAPGAYIRPSPTSGALGGVAAHTREAMLLCEAAGYDVILVETVGVGQSETAVAGMTDSFVLLQLPNAGDDLQAIKKGVVELADLIVYNKADLDPLASEVAAGQMKSALTLLRPVSQHWRPPVLQVCATRGDGVAPFWATILAHHKAMQDSGELVRKRRRQALDWMWGLIDGSLRARFEQHARVRAALPIQVAAVLAGTVSPTTAAAALLDAMSAPEMPLQ